MADEENGGRLGARWLVDHRPDLFEGCTDAIGEVGGFSATMPSGRRLYLVETAEKGVVWVRVTARGVAGHGSMLNTSNSIVALAEILHRIGVHQFPIQLTPTTRQFFDVLSAELGRDFQRRDPDALLDAIAPLKRIVGASLRQIVSPTLVRAGNKTNVIPSEASVELDCPFPAGPRGRAGRLGREVSRPGRDL